MQLLRGLRDIGCRMTDCPGRQGSSVSLLDSTESASLLGTSCRCFPCACSSVPTLWLCIAAGCVHFPTMRQIHLDFASWSTILRWFMMTSQHTCDPWTQTLESLFQMTKARYPKVSMNMNRKMNTKTNLNRNVNLKLKTNPILHMHIRIQSMASTNINRIINTDKSRIIKLTMNHKRKKPNNKNQYKHPQKHADFHFTSFTDVSHLV